MSNTWKWVAVLGLGGLIGLGDVFTDATFPGWWDVIRHVGSGMVAAGVGLKVPLGIKSNGTTPTPTPPVTGVK